MKHLIELSIIIFIYLFTGLISLFIIYSVIHILSTLL